jgi:hypothetical protein
MKMLSRALAVAGACLFLSLGIVAFATAQTRTLVADQTQKGSTMMKHARGTFEVKLSPQTPDDKATDSAVGRYLIEKQFHGDLEGTSRGQMLGASTAVETSKGYVAMEQVTATLDGRRGTFVLQHSGTMTRGALQLSVTVVPDSATGELVGLTGKMEIKIEGGKHYYDFEYTLGDDK